MDWIIYISFFYIYGTSLTLPHFCACHKPGPGFPTSYVVVFYVFNEMRRGVVVCFVNIGGIVDHHSLNVLFKTLRCMKQT